MKEYGDEEFIQLLREGLEDARNQDIRKGSVWVGGDEVLFTEREIMKKKLWMWLPQDFRLLGQERAERKYPDENGPDIIYTNPQTTVNVTFSPQTLAGGYEKEICIFMERQIRESYPGSSILGIKTISAGELPIECLEFVVPAMDARIYNQMFFMPLDARLLIGNCNCLEQERDEWEEVFDQMQASIRVAS